MQRFLLDARLIKKEDICALTRTAAEISGLPYVMDLDRAESEEILSKV